MEVSANVLVIAFNCLFKRACCAHHIDTDIRKIPFSKATGFPCNMKQQLCSLTKVETKYRTPEFQHSNTRKSVCLVCF